MTTNMADKAETPAEEQQEQVVQEDGDVAPPTEDVPNPPAEGEVAPEVPAETTDEAPPAEESAAPPPEGEQAPAEEVAPPPAEGDENAPADENAPTAEEGEKVEEPTAAETTGAPAPEGEEAPAEEAEAAAEPGAPEASAPESGAPEADAPESTEAAAPSAEATDEPPVEGGEEAPPPAAEGEEGAPSDTGAEHVLADVQEEDEEDAEGKAEEGKADGTPVPQSDTFAEGEKPETSLIVGENLSREGSLVESEGRKESPPIPGSPGEMRHLDEGDEEEEEDEQYEFEEEQVGFDRDQLIERYHQALTEREQLQQQNFQLQHKLAEYFKKKKSDEQKQDTDKNITDQEQRYLKYMANLDELRQQEIAEQEDYESQIDEVRSRCTEKQATAEKETGRFMEFKRQVAQNALSARSGKPIAPRDIEQYLTTEDRKEQEVITVRLENIKLKNKLKKKEMQLKSKEELAEGLHLIDFEQLKIENQTYNEKIEERNEELLKLRKKITSTVQVLTHLKEKLQFVQAENAIQKDKLQDVEELAARKRDILSRTKQARDALRIDNQRLRQNCGLLGNTSLLRDFEERKDESDDLMKKLEGLKMQHAELTLNCNGIRRKLEQAKAARA